MVNSDLNGALMRMVICESAFKAIQDDCRRHRSIETGGLMVGEWREDLCIIHYVIDAGPEATRKLAFFSPDIAYQQKQLDPLLQANRGLTLCGFWHKHPDGMPHNSGHDLGSARRVIETWGLDSPSIISAIACYSSDELGFTPFLLEINSRDFVPMKLEVLPDDDPTFCIEAEERSVDANENADPEWYDVKTGKSWLKSFLVGFENDRWKIHARKNSDGRLTLEASDSGKPALILLFPESFPYQPPEILRLVPQRVDCWTDASRLSKNIKKHLKNNTRRFRLNL